MPRNALDVFTHKRASLSCVAWSSGVCVVCVRLHRISAGVLSSERLSTGVLDGLRMRLLTHTAARRHHPAPSLPTTTPLCNPLPVHPFPLLWRTPLADRRVYRQCVDQ